MPESYPPVGEPSPVKLYRVMKVNADGNPLIGTRRNMLGVRPTDPTNTQRGRKFDVAAVMGSDSVTPGAGEGLSVSTEPGRLLVGPGEALWEIESDGLRDLAAAKDTETHYLIEPNRAMTLDEYQDTLAATQLQWNRVT
jgi:hypothetical protein